MGAVASTDGGDGSLTRGERLSAEDLSVLSLENEEVVGHTCKVIVLQQGIDPGLLRASIASRLPRAPRLGMGLSYLGGEAWWVPVREPDLNAHIVVADGRRPLQLRETVARLFEQRLDRSRPLWRIDVVPELATGGSALIWRIHHALADGASAMKMASAVMWDEESIDDTAVGASRNKLAAPVATKRAHPGLDSVLAAAREAPHPWHRSPFDGRICARREVAFASVDFGGLHDVARATTGATINDAVLAVVGGAIRRWLERQHGRLGPVRVKVPVSLHGAAGNSIDADADPGNRDSFFCLDVPIDSADPLRRLAEISRATRTRKQGHDAEQLDGLMRELGRVPALRRFAERALAHPRSFALNVSNVRGPRGTLHVLDSRVNALYSIAEIREHHALRIAVLSQHGSLNFGLAADPTLIEDVAQLATDIEAEARALIDCVRYV